MLNLPIFGKKKLNLAFEYGVVLSQVAQKQGVELTPEIVARAEKMIQNEFKSYSATHLATHMEALILTIFELDMTK